MALELKERKMIDGVFPVMIGDIRADSDVVGNVEITYSHYFQSGCNPAAPNIVVEEVEKKLHEHLNREGLGVPYKERMTVKDVLTSILANQGSFFSGSKEVFFPAVIQSIVSMVQIAKMEQQYDNDVDHDPSNEHELNMPSETRRSFRNRASASMRRI